MDARSGWAFQQASASAPGSLAGPSEPVFNDGEALLRVAEKHGLEGIVSKRRDGPYRSGAHRGWREVKPQAWHETNKERWRSFERGR